MTTATCFASSIAALPLPPERNDVARDGHRVQRALPARSHEQERRRCRNGNGAAGSTTSTYSACSASIAKNAIGSSTTTATCIASSIAALALALPPERNDVAH